MISTLRRSLLLLLLALAPAPVASLAAGCGPKSTTPAGDGAGPGGGGGEGGAEERKPGWDEALVTSMLADVRKTIGCPSAGSKHRHWCLAAEGWATGQAEPPQPGLYVGLTLSIADGEPIDDWLETGVTFSALGLRADGETRLGRIAALVPSNQEESALIAPAIASVISVLHAEAKAVTLPPDLATYLADLPAEASYALAPAAKGWTWTGASATELRKAGDYWIAIEIPAEGPPGILVSIFTDRIAK
jgi:hypothetical protein